MALFKKTYAYYVVYKYKKADGNSGIVATVVEVSKKVKRLWDIRQLKEKVYELFDDDDGVVIVLINWKLMKW